MINKNNYSLLGHTNIRVSNLCFGTLTVSPLQCNFTNKEASELFCYAIDKGINFFDTAELYNTYCSLKEAILYKEDIVIASKAYCHDEKTAQKSIDKALIALDRSYIDIFLLHEQESRCTIEGHWGAIEHIRKRIKQGDVRAGGLSTHHISAVEASLGIEELEIIHPIYNYKALGIIDGDDVEMKSAITKAIADGKGVYLMKALGGGHLINDAKKAINFARNIKGISSIAVGMKSTDEIDYNYALFNNELPNETATNNISMIERKLYIHDWCIGCGRCVEACQHNALQLIDNKVVINRNKCVLCGYCADKCKDFCIKVI